MSFSGPFEEEKKAINWYWLTWGMVVLILVGTIWTCCATAKPPRKDYAVTAYATDQYGRKTEMDKWWHCSKPEQNPDGSFTIKNYYTDGKILLPKNTEFIIEENE